MDQTVLSVPMVVCHCIVAATNLRRNHDRTATVSRMSLPSTIYGTQGAQKILVGLKSTCTHDDRALLLLIIKGDVHFDDLYASINVIRRTPPLIR